MRGTRLSSFARTIIILICIAFLSTLLSAQESTRNGTAIRGVLTINISVASRIFTAKMFDNETTRALIAQLPMSINMSELNRREKYYHLPNDLPAESTERPVTIYAGEIMCWSSNSLVLFYNTFSNSYGGYVRLGRIEDISGLASALGTGNVQVTFSLGD